MQEDFKKFILFFHKHFDDQLVVITQYDYIQKLRQKLFQKNQKRVINYNFSGTFNETLINIILNDIEKNLKTKTILVVLEDEDWKILTDYVSNNEHRKFFWMRLVLGSILFQKRDRKIDCTYEIIAQHNFR